MAIRIELPPAIFLRLRLRWNSIHLQIARQTRVVRNYTYRVSAASQSWRRQTSERVSLRSRLRARALQKRSDRLTEFEERYEELVDLLCWAAKDGVHTDLDARYAQLRHWMREHYPVLRRELRPHWAESDATGLSDPFEALFCPESVDVVIHASSGIEDMMRARKALDCYREALRD